MNMSEIIKEKNLEEIVLRGLEYENIEKKKAAERKALTRKHGLKPEDAKYVQNTTGQTRDIVADKLGISGRQWERMKFIYQHRDCLLEEEYESWCIGKISTSKIYNELSKDIRYNDTLDNMLEILNEMQSDILIFETSHVLTDIQRDVLGALFPCHENTKTDVMNNFDRLIKYNQRVLSKYYDEISMMKSSIIDLKRKLKRKTHDDI